MNVRKNRSARFVQRVLVLGAACFALTAGAGAAQAEEAAAKPAKKQVLLLGSSSMNDSFGHLVAADFAKQGYDVVRKGVPAAGFSRPDYRDMFEVADKLDISSSTDLVIVYLGMNDAQSFFLRPSERGDDGGKWIKFEDEARWAKAYEERATAFLEGVCKRGAKKTVVLLPIDVKSPVMQKRLDRIRDAQKAAATHAGCSTALATTGDVGNWTVKGKSTRASDGVHMSREGAEVIWDRVKSKVLSLVTS